MRKVRPLKAVILAAGYATRLYPLTRSKPKCLLSVGGRPLLDILCGKLRPIKNLEEIIIVTNAKFYGQFEAWKRGARSPLPVSLLNDGTRSNKTRLGAVGDLDFAIRSASIGADVLLLASDNVFQAGLDGFVDFCRRRKAIGVALHDLKDPRLAAGKYGVMQIGRNGTILKMEEKPQEPCSSLIGTGIYYFPESSLKWVGRYLGCKEAKDAPGYYLEWLLGRVRMVGFLLPGLWYDIGGLEALKEAGKVFRKKGIER
ncbi:MAG: nucleotidyltransferase family protein [Candidatus Omnitrophica bacterium]|nr:nucleotidyltransferase family protein [Candidatus Omnitrophota bacterium]